VNRNPQREFDDPFAGFALGQLCGRDVATGGGAGKVERHHGFFGLGQWGGSAQQKANGNNRSP
jgi:hypothetical protein